MAAPSAGTVAEPGGAAVQRHPRAVGSPRPNGTPNPYLPPDKGLFKVGYAHVVGRVGGVGRSSLNLPVSMRRTTRRKRSA